MVELDETIDQVKKATGDQEGKYLTFTLAQEEYGIGILKIKEIIGMMPITTVPQTPDFVKGVINLRGKVIPVMDLRLRFGMEGIEYNERTCIIVVEIEGSTGLLQIGIVVDSVSEVLNIKAEDIVAGWVTYKPVMSPLTLLEKAVFGEHLETLFAQAEPKEYRYSGLKRALVEYLELQNKGGWSYVPLEGILRVGKHHEQIPALRERLRVTGEYRSCYTEETTLYDECLKEAVIRFQARHGLVAKGVIGPNTMGAMNVPVEKRIEQIRLNMDRIKWLNQRHSYRHIIINIPAFTLFFEEDNALRQEMKVITCTRRNPTPIF